MQNEKGFHTAFGSIDGLQATYWGSGNSNRTRGRSAKGTLACVFVLLKPSGQWPSRLSIFSHVLFDLGHLKVCSPVTREPSWATSRFQKGRQSRPTVAPLPVETWNNRRDLLVRSPLQIESIEDIWRYQEGEKNTPAGRTAKITLRPAPQYPITQEKGKIPTGTMLATLACQETKSFHSSSVLGSDDRLGRLGVVALGLWEWWSNQFLAD